MSTNYDEYIDEKDVNKINNQICLLHQIILTNDLIKIKNDMLYSRKNLLYNNNKIIDDYYQPFMIIRRKMCERLNLKYMEMVTNNIFVF
jgi:hypothetical protein